MLTDLKDFKRIAKFKSVKIYTAFEPQQINAHRFNGFQQNS